MYKLNVPEIALTLGAIMSKHLDVTKLKSLGFLILPNMFNVNLIFLIKS